MREVDRLTTEKYHIPSIQLMENAAHAVARVVTEKLGGSVEGRRILIVCGKGNNGGDGAALARVLYSQGASCFVYLVGAAAETNGDARTNFEALRALSESPNSNSPNKNCLIINEIDIKNCQSFSNDWQNEPGNILVDALFGTGLARPLQGPFARIAETIASAQKERIFEKVIAIDLPSGLDADCEMTIGPHACADVTVTFTASKAANILPPSSVFNGELVIANIGSPQELVNEQPSQLFLTEKKDAVQWLRRTEFTSSSYKNKRGHVLIIAGSESYSGAAVMAGNAAIRSGVGLVTLCVPASVKGEAASRSLPEIIVRPINESKKSVAVNAFAELTDTIKLADGIAVGCGLSAADTGVEKLVRQIVENRTAPVIIDAGALMFYSPANQTLYEATQRQRDNNAPPLILTPHEGEFMRLLGTDDKTAIRDRVAAVRDFSTTHNLILVLKGERVLIGEPGGKVIVNPTGNSGLGKAGNGDTLTGILAGFVAQAVKFKIDIFETVVAAVYVAGMAGDAAEKKYGKRVMTASDVRECLVDVFNDLDAE